MSTDTTVMTACHRVSLNLRMGMGGGGMIRGYDCDFVTLHDKAPEGMGARML